MDKEILISPEIKKVWPETALAILEYEATVEQSGQELLQVFEDMIVSLAQQYTLQTITDNTHISATRRAYKALGKSPHEYRNAAEAMLRRIVKGNGLYHINNIVEINNLISVSSGFSIGSYDRDAIGASITLKPAEDDAHYGGIGKSSVNIGHLPTLFDESGPFGNPTSDSRRAMIQPGNRKIMSVIYAFDASDDLEKWSEQFAQKLLRFTNATTPEIAIIF